MLRSAHRRARLPADVMKRQRWSVLAPESLIRTAVPQPAIQLAPSAHQEGEPGKSQEAEQWPPPTPREAVAV